MNIAVIGAGNIGGNIARQLAGSEHALTLSFARDTAALRALAEETGAQVATAAQAAAAAEVVVISVPWGVLPDALAQTGSLDGRVVIDTTNHFGSGPGPAEGQRAASFNADRMPGARYTKAFNTLTAAFQAQAVGRPREQRIVQWLCGDDDDDEAKQLVAGLIEQAGYVAVDVGGIADCAVMESPRREGAVYGEEWRLPEAFEVVKAVRAGRPIPPTPSYAQVS